MIICAGAIDSPKILLLSGIGPQEDLSKLQIPVVQHLPGVGRNLQDHYFFELVTIQKPDTHNRTSYMNGPEAIEKARKQWIEEDTGPFSNNCLSQMIAYLRSDRVLHSEQFSKLDAAVRDRYRDKTKPNYELLSVSRYGAELNLETNDVLSNPAFPWFRCPVTSALPWNCCGIYGTSVFRNGDTTLHKPQRPTPYRPQILVTSF